MSWRTERAFTAARRRELGKLRFPVRRGRSIPDDASTTATAGSEERSERSADRREADDCSNGVLASAASEGSIDERSESIGERSEP
jgi:hypothetical protein